MEDTYRRRVKGWIFPIQNKLLRTFSTIFEDIYIFEKVSKKCHFFAIWWRQCQWHTKRHRQGQMISFEKIYGLYCLKHNIVDINGNVQNENSRQSCLLQDCVSVPVLVQMEALPPNLAMLHPRDLLWLWIIQAEHDFIFQGLFHLFHGIGKTKYRKKVV